MTERRYQGKLQTLLFFFLLLLSVFLLLHTTEIALATQSGLRLCFYVIIPSLFPFLILSQLFVPLVPHGKNEKNALFSKLFRLPTVGKSALLLGFISGFPIGAKTIAELYTDGALSSEEATRLLSFCNNTGPAFLIGGVGALFHSVQFGVFLYLSEILLSLLTGFLLGRGKSVSCSDKASEKKLFVRNSPSLVDAIAKSGAAILKICSFVVAFQIFIGIFDIFFQNTVITASFSAFFEVGTAVSRAAECLSLSPSLAAAIAAFSVSFSGISVFLQSEAFLREAGLSFLPAIPAKILQGVGASILAFFFTPFFFQ